MSYLTFAILTLLILLVSHSSLTDLLVSWTLHKHSQSACASAGNLYIRFHNVVIFSGSGIVFFSLLSGIRHFLIASKINAPHVRAYGLLIAEILLWAVVFVFGDIVMQNLGAKAVMLSNFTMRYTAIGGLVAMEIIVLRNFFAGSRKN